MSESLSLRSARAREPGLPYLDLVFRSRGNLHDPDSNPAGIVSLCVAENGLSSSLVLDKLRDVAIASTATPGLMGYDDMRGRHHLRRAFAGLAERHITGGAPVEFAHLSIANGCTSLIQHLA